MPELPDIEAYLHAIRVRAGGSVLTKVELLSPFLLRTVSPAPSSITGQRLTEVRRLGKRLCLGFDHDVWLVLHLMIAGRLHWNRRSGAKPLARFEFEAGTLTLTEAGTQRRASLHVVQGEAALAAMNPGGVEPLECTPGEFRTALTRESHTLKRALTDPHLFSGIGNAYSDEILWLARLSPVQLTGRMTDAEIHRLFEATRECLKSWMERLAGDEFPENVTAFRPEMAVHGKYQQPCPACGSKVQRIRYASNETNYCPRCQTGGRLLADRSLSRLLGKDWPKSIDDLP